MTRFTLIAILSATLNQNAFALDIYSCLQTSAVILSGHKHHIESRETQKTPFTIVADKNSFKFSNFGELDLHYEASTDHSAANTVIKKYYKQYTVRYTHDDVVHVLRLDSAGHLSWHLIFFGGGPLMHTTTKVSAKCTHTKQ